MAREPEVDMDNFDQREPARFAARFELRFQFLFNPGRAMIFPCDSNGHVDLDSLSERARNNLYFVRTLIGRDYAVPEVVEAVAE
jgi:hypothetical protein